MKPPKCPVCGSRHHLREPHVFSEERPRQSMVAAEPKPTAPHHGVAHTGDMANTSHMANTLANNLSNPNAHLANAAAPGRNRASTTYRFRNPDKRRAYMASYMRTYRKRAPEKATAAA